MYSIKQGIFAVQLHKIQTVSKHPRHGPLVGIHDLGRIEVGAHRQHALPAVNFHGLTKAGLQIVGVFRIEEGRARMQLSEKCRVMQIDFESIAAGSGTEQRGRLILAPLEHSEPLLGPERHAVPGSGFHRQGRLGDAAGKHDKAACDQSKDIPERENQERSHGLSLEHEECGTAFSREDFF